MAVIDLDSLTECEFSETDMRLYEEACGYKDPKKSSEIMAGFIKSLKIESGEFVMIDTVMGEKIGMRSLGDYAFLLSRHMSLSPQKANRNTQYKFGLKDEDGGQLIIFRA
tara:strand:+ start:114 stop:443 length:330 start_codon:yes stop_codon:yes gene_type:complete